MPQIFTYKQVVAVCVCFLLFGNYKGSAEVIKIENHDKNGKGGKN